MPHNATVSSPAPASVSLIDDRTSGAPLRIALVAGEAVRDEFEVRGVVGDHEPGELPFRAQQVRHQLAAGRGRQ